MPAMAMHPYLAVPILLGLDSRIAVLGTCEAWGWISFSSSSETSFSSNDLFSPGEEPLGNPELNPPW